jgi:hypothetical protein
MGNKSSSKHAAPAGDDAQQPSTSRPHKGKLYGLKKRFSFRKHKAETGAHADEGAASTSAPTEPIIIPNSVKPSERAPSRGAAGGGGLSPSQREEKERQERRGSMTDKAVNTELWQKILDGSIVGTKLVQKALIYRLTTGTIIVTNPAEFRPSVRQLVHISEGIQDPTAIAKDGVDLLADSFQYQNGVPGSRLEGVDESGEQVVIVNAGQNYALVGIASWTRRDEVKKLFSELCEYFATQSEF